MKILISAYACEPGRGGESEVGFRTSLAAARDNDVWVLTRANHSEQLSAALALEENAHRIHVVGFDVPGLAKRLKKQRPLGLHWYYDTWQRAAAERASELHADVRFDVAHHVTFANFWTRTGISTLDIPFVWGPVGGAVDTPTSLLRELGLRGAVNDLGRAAARLALSPIARRVARRSAVVFVQNPETGRYLTTSRRVVVLPNATAANIDALPAPAGNSKEVAVVGRLIPLKAGKLALRVIRRLPSDVRLVFFGDGPDRERLVRIARRWNLEDRVDFAGRVDRATLLDRLSQTGVLLHPSLHEEAGMAVTEALTLGTPVVCLNHGGPAELARRWPTERSFAVDPSSPEATADRLAIAVSRFLESSVAQGARTLAHPTPDFGDAILNAYRLAVEG